MFRLHRSKAAKSGERVDFKFSNFQATQVGYLFCGKERKMLDNISPFQAFFFLCSSSFFDGIKHSLYFLVCTF